MSDADSESELIEAKEPFIEKPKHAPKDNNNTKARHKNRFRIHKRKRLACIGAILAVVIVVIVLILVFALDDDTYEYSYNRMLYSSDNTSNNNFNHNIRNNWRQKKIILLNWNPATRWSTPFKCNFEIKQHFEWQMLYNADAIIVNTSIASASQIQFPTHRRYKPCFILATQQPQYAPENNQSENVNITNVYRTFSKTFSYNLESDLLWQTYQVRYLPTNDLFTPSLNPNWPNLTVFENPRSKQYYENKYNYTLPIAMTVINGPCNGTRYALAQKLSEYMEVHIYGTCSQMSCRYNNCEQLPSYYKQKQYKFYLAIENNNCTDYISDDFYKALEYTVPVVLGGANYELFAPPNSYIDATSFNSIQALANYLKYLDEYPEKYINYYIWRQRFYVYQSSGSFESICDYVLGLNTNYYNELDYYKFERWWERSKCYPSFETHLLFNE